MEQMDLEDYIKNGKGKRIFYRRVSSNTQEFHRQVIPEIAFDKVFEEKLSGKNRERPQLRQMLDYIRDGDRVYVYDLSRLGRNMIDLDKIINEVLEKGACITFWKEQITHVPNDADPFKLMQRQMLSVYAEFERNLLRQRTQEGIEKAKAEERWHLKMTDDKIKLARDLVKAGVPMTRVAKQLSVTRQTLYNHLKI